MSTAVLTRRKPIASPAVKTRPKPKRITVAAVRAALEEVARRHPCKVFRSPADEQPRYLRHGAPASLAARVLDALGYNTGVLSALEAEHPVGDFFHAGVRIEESRHPALKRLDANARALLAWVQERDTGRLWSSIADQAFRPKRFWQRLRVDQQRRPWLYG